jgi:flagellar hook assembly protein FlgD
VRRLLRNSLQSAGTHTIEWKGVDSTGQSVSSGLYFVRIKSGANSVAALLAIS